MTVDKGTWKTITSAHMDLAKAIVGDLRQSTMHPDDVLAVACCMVACVATLATEPVAVVENGIATLAQISPKLRGPLAKAVLDTLAEELEPSSV